MTSMSNQTINQLLIDHPQ